MRLPWGSLGCLMQGWINRAPEARLFGAPNSVRIRSIKSKHPTPVIAIVALKERARYEPLLLEAGADCVLELLCMKVAWEWLVPGLCVARLSGGHHECHAIRIRFGLDCLLP